MEKKYWKPSITSQFRICSVPYRLDTYSGCVYDCAYCFSKCAQAFLRRNSEHPEFNYVVGLKTESFEKWIERIMKKDYDYNRAEEVAFKERIPLKIGGMSDPFQPIEKSEKITYKTLKILDKYNYPVELQTKNPKGFLDICDEFLYSNITIAITLITADDKFSKIVEPNAPLPSKRLEAIKELTDKGFNVMIKIQPAIYPKILEDLPELIKMASKVGVWAFNIEGLKCAISMPKSLQEEFQGIGDYLNINMREFYKSERKYECNRGSDYELSNEKKREIFEIASRLSKEYDIKFFNADNYMDKKYGEGCECCGTEKLKDYKLFPHDKRSLVYGNNKGSTEIGKCKANFLRDRTKTLKFKTLEEICEDFNKSN